MAQGLLQDALQRAGVVGIDVESAGIHAIEGMSPTRETISVLQSAGIDMTPHRAQGVRSDMVDGADVIFVMERLQAEEILRRYPQASGKTHLLRPYGVAQGELMGAPGIPDPIGKPLEVYEVCFAEIREAVERIAKSLTDVPRS